MSHDEVLISIPNMVRVSSRRFGDRVALIDEAIRWSFHDLERAMLDSVKAMIALGVKPGDRVALCGPNSALWIQAALGIQGAGGVLVPVNTRFKGKEIGHLLTTSDAAAFITAGEFLGNDYIAQVRAAVPDARAVGKIVTLNDEEVDGTVAFSDLILRGRELVSDAEAHASIDAVRSDQLSDVMFTSGTTGAPKGVRITHAQSLHAYGDMGEIMGLEEGDCILVIPPFFHAFGYKAGWMVGFAFGCTVVPQRTFDATQILDRIQAFRVSCMFGPPTIFQDLMAHPDLDSYDYSSLRVTVISAAMVPVQLIHDLREILRFDVVLSGFGLTEATAIVSICRPGDSPERVASTAGRPFPDVEVKVVDDDGNDLEAGQEGEILVRGYNVMSGYWEDPKGSEAALTPDGWLRTGDIGVVDQDGYVAITDRKKDMFIVGGFNAYPAEIENILNSFEKILHVAVIGVPDERMGEVGAAFVIPRPGVTLTEEEVTAYARANLANFKVPRYVYIVESLPRNASMKVLKPELRKMLQALPVSDSGGLKGA